MKENKKTGILIFIIFAIVLVVLLIMILNPGKKNKNEIEQVQDLNTQDLYSQNSNVQAQTGKIEEYAKLNSKGEKVNTSERINQTKEMEEFTLSNVSLKETNGKTVMSARITNKSGKKQEGFYGNIILLDKSSKEIGRIPLNVSAMEINESKEIKASITESYVEKAYDYRIEK